MKYYCFEFKAPGFIRLNKVGLTVLSVIMLSFSMPSFSAPDVVSATAEGGFGEGAIVTLSGSGFGTKSQTAPIMYDVGDQAYINGSVNKHHASFVDNQTIERADTDPDTLWAKASLEGSFAQSVFYSRSRLQRHERVKGHYYGKGPSAYVGWPVAYGGLTPPSGNKQLYVSWWFKHKWDLNKWIVFEYSSMKGAFITESSPWKAGEDITFSNGQTGRVVHVDTSLGLIYTMAQYQGVNYPEGTVISGNNSNASATILKLHWNVGSNKFIRVWDNPNGKSLRVSWTNNQITGAGIQTNNWVWWEYESEVWHHLEYIMDVDKGYIATYVDGKLEHEQQNLPIADSIDPNFSPTIGLLGWNGKLQLWQEFDFGEIYMDNTLQRVVVGTSSSYKSLTDFELQVPMTWGNSSIGFKVYLGSLPVNKPLYAYVFDKDGNVNQLGHCLKNCGVLSENSAPRPFTMVN